MDPDTKVGPMIERPHLDKVLGYIDAGRAEGATVRAGGERILTETGGWFVAPTIFAGVRNSMSIAREEIFGPVLAILPYDDEEEAIRIANDTPYGLSGYVASGDPEHALRVAARLRTGNVHLNGAGPDFAAPFGGYKQSGNGREWGAFGFEEFLEVKAILGCKASA
jgi:aldehyde dehydrogenase (NAD+)